MKSSKGRKDLRDKRDPRDLSLTIPGLGLGAFDQAGAGHALAQATLLDKSFLQVLKLPVQEIASNVDQANNHIGADGRVRIFNPFAESLIGGIVDAIELSQASCVAMIFRPFFEA